MANQIEITGKISATTKVGLVKASKKLLTHFKINQSRLDIFFLKNPEMVNLKKAHLKNKPGPANTLSFAPVDSFPHPETNKKPLGEIYLNLDLTEGKLEKILPLLIHSFLHLLGYHHRNRRDMITMERLGKELLQSVNSKRS